MGRHAKTGRGARRGYLIAGVIAACVGLGIAGLVVFRASAPAVTSANRGAGSTSSPSTAPAAPCPSTAKVAVPPGYVAAFTSVAQAFSLAQHSNCDPLSVTGTASTGAPVSTSAGTDPTVWMAESATALATLAKGITVTGTSPTVATSPLVVAFPTPLAQALGWPRQQFDTALLQSLLLGTKTWATLGHPEWGGFRLVLADPAVAGSGTAAYNALVTIAHGGPLTSTPSFVNPSNADLATIRVEQAVASTAPNDQAVLAGATGIASSLAATSGYVTTEQELLAHNESSALKLTGFYLADGSAAVDFRAVQLGLSANASGMAAKAARAFTTYLTSAAGATALRAAGLRDPAGDGPTGEQATTQQIASAANPQTLPGVAASKVQQLWTFMHTRNSTLALVDVSGSMADLFPGTTTSKIDVVRQIMAASYVVASPKAASGVWYFHAAPDGSPIIDTTSGLALNNAAGPQGQTHAQFVVAQAATQTAIGGTPLYEAIREGYANAVANYQPTMVNQLVVLTDGQDQDSTSPLTVDQLVAAMQQSAVASKPIRVILFGIGPDADMGALQAIAAPFKGTAVQVSAPSGIAAAVTTALFS